MIYCAKFVESVTFGDKLQQQQQTPRAVLSSGEEEHTELQRGIRLEVIFFEYY